jgi:hypothetical protein
MVVSANRKGRIQSSESGTDLKIMQVGQGQGTDMFVSANTKGRMQSSESRVGKDYAGRSRAGYRHGCISIQQTGRAECRVQKAEQI